MFDVPLSGTRLADWAERTLIPLSAIAALIFVAIGASRPVWLDEVSSLSFATQDLHGLVEILRKDTNLPAYYLILHQWIAVFGDSEAASRSLSAIFYLGTIVVVFVTGRFLFSDTRSALYCAFFYLISVQAIRQAQNIRGYTLLGFVAALSIFFFLRWIRTDSPPGTGGVDAPSRERSEGIFERRSQPSFARRGIWYLSLPLVLVNAFGSLTHMWFFFLLGAEVLVCAVFAPRKLVRGGVLAAVSLLPFAFLWFRPLLDQLQNGATASLNSGMPPSHWIFLPDVMVQYWGGPFEGMYFYAICIVCIVLGRSEGESFSASLRTPGVRELTLLFATTVLIPISVSVFKPIYSPGKYTTIALPALAILIGTLLTRSARRSLLLAFCYGLLVWTTVSHIQARNDLRDLPPGQSDSYTAKYIAQHAQRGDVVVFTSLSRPAVDFYLKRFGCGECFREVSFPAAMDSHPFWRDVPKMLENRSSLEAEAARSVAEWNQLTARDGTSIWMLYGYDTRVSRILKEQMDHHFSLEQRLDLYGPYHDSLFKYRR
jgi:4-amino-4-deoxy-L-arabinose transferase-like glycosyltransferase